MLLVVLATLFFGIFTMGRGGENAPKLSNKIMRYRVVLQAIAVLIFCVVLLMASGK